jgi:hypothetical protein
MKKILIGAITAGLLLVGGATAFAATSGTPAEIYAKLKGITVEEAYAQRAAGDTYGELAAEAGFLDEFQAETLATKKTIVQERVANGTLTQSQADAIISRMEQTIANCDGTGNGLGQGGMYGRGNGGGNGLGMGACGGYGARGGNGAGYGANGNGNANK